MRNKYFGRTVALGLIGGLAAAVNSGCVTLVTSIARANEQRNPPQEVKYHDRSQDHDVARDSLGDQKYSASKDGAENAIREKYGID